MYYLKLAVIKYDKVHYTQATKPLLNTVCTVEALVQF